MKIDVLISPSGADELFFTGKTTVVIDVLRATTTIVAALTNGAREVIPVNTVEFAMKVSGGALGGQTILAGERNAVKIDGFALGNSPLEFTEDVVGGKSIVLFTTNGSKAIVKSKFSENLLIASFSNIKAVAEHVAKLGKNTTIVCSGNHNMFSMEDSVCAGYLIKEIGNLVESIELGDAGLACRMLCDQYGDKFEFLLKNSTHGVNLIEKGFEEDVIFCSKKDISDIVPVYNSGVVKPLIKDEE